LSSDFPTVYSAVIITKGDSAYVVVKDEAVFLEGVKLAPGDHIGPKEAVTMHLSDQCGIKFTEDWLLYVCMTTHKNECAPTGEHDTETFIVSHYWIDITNLHSFEMPSDWTELPLEDVANNKNKNVFHADQLAAQTVLEMKNEG
jgi:hypothetical protein